MVFVDPNGQESIGNWPVYIASAPWVPLTDTSPPALASLSESLVVV